MLLHPDLQPVDLLGEVRTGGIDLVEDEPLEDVRGLALFLPCILDLHQLLHQDAPARKRLCRFRVHDQRIGIRDAHGRLDDGALSRREDVDEDEVPATMFGRQGLQEAGEHGTPNGPLGHLRAGGHLGQVPFPAGEEVEREVGVFGGNADATDAGERALGLDGHNVFQPGAGLGEGIAVLGHANHPLEMKAKAGT